MVWFIGQSLLIILAAFLLGLLAGWFVWGNRKSSPSPSDGASAAVLEKNNGMVVTSHGSVIRTTETEAHHAPGEEVLRDTRPIMTKDKATSTKPDDTLNEDLERIEGIGPQIAAALRAAGIHSFSQLAETDVDTRRAAIEAAGITFAPSLVTWARQAQLLADGDEDGFVELTQRLVAGRDTGRA